MDLWFAVPWLATAVVLVIVQVKVLFPSSGHYNIYGLGIVASQQWGCIPVLLEQVYASDSTMSTALQGWGVMICMVDHY
uniref:Uncharacterized protein n=1 Tax=Oryza punctata TaxID=4537 RepID=A0A0E0M0R7_ORYPU